MSDTKTKVVWSMTTDEHDERFASPVAKRESVMYDLRYLCSDTGEEVAGDLAARYFDFEERWAAHIGDDVWQATVLVRIHEPESIAGLYVVYVERSVTARATQLAEVRT